MCTQQLYAMFIKRVLNSYRSRLVTLVQLLVPIVFTAIGCSVKYTLPSDEDPTALAIRFSHFDDPITPYLG